MMETGRVAAVRPVAAVLLAAVCAGCTGAVSPGTVVGEAAGALLAAAPVGVAGALLAAVPVGVAGALLAAASVVVVKGLGEGKSVLSPALVSGGGVGASTAPCTT